MRIRSQQLARALFEAVSEHTAQADKITRNFIDFCKRKGLVDLLSEVADHVEKLQKERVASAKLQVEVSHPVSSKVVTEIENFVSVQANIEKDVMVNPDIVGGFIARYDDIVYDASLRNQLEKLKQTLT